MLKGLRAQVVEATIVGVEDTVVVVVVAIVDEEAAAEVMDMVRIGKDHHTLTAEPLASMDHQHERNTG